MAGPVVAVRSSEPDVRFWPARLARSHTNGCPNSPAVKESVEQKPSDDVMRRVRPSFDLQSGLVDK